MTEVTLLLEQIEQGRTLATRQLFPIVYDELKKIAADRLSDEKPGQTLQPTALVHEAWLRLVDVERARHWDSRGHFFAAAAEAMRRILVEAARRKGRIRHGGGRRRVDIADFSADQPAAELLDLDEALTRLEQQDRTKAELVQLKFFGGMSTAQAAEILGISLATAERYWAFARTWLYAELNAEVKKNKNS